MLASDLPIHTPSSLHPNTCAISILANSPLKTMPMSLGSAKGLRLLQSLLGPSNAL